MREFLGTVTHQMAVLEPLSCMLPNPCGSIGTARSISLPLKDLNENYAPFQQGASSLCMSASSMSGFQR